jgi:hypothetical protein
VTHYGVTQIFYTLRDSDLLLYIGNMTICLGVGVVIEKGLLQSWFVICNRLPWKQMYNESTISANIKMHLFEL